MHQSRATSVSYLKSFGSSRVQDASRFVIAHARSGQRNIKIQLRSTVENKTNGAKDAIDYPKSSESIDVNWNKRLRLFHQNLIVHVPPPAKVCRKHDSNTRIATTLIQLPRTKNCDVASRSRCVGVKQAERLVPNSERSELITLDNSFGASAAAKHPAPVRLVAASNSISASAETCGGAESRHAKQTRPSFDGPSRDGSVAATAGVASGPQDPIRSAA